MRFQRFWGTSNSSRLKTETHTLTSPPTQLWCISVPELFSSQDYFDHAIKNYPKLFLAAELFSSFSATIQNPFEKCQRDGNIQGVLQKCDVSTADCVENHTNVPP